MSRRSAAPKEVPRERYFRMLDAEVALARRISSVETIFRGLTTPEIRKKRAREAIGDRMDQFGAEFRKVYGGVP